MNNITLYTNALLIILLTGVQPIIGQEKEEQENNTRPGQITFVTPLGTNGYKSPEISNNFSLNILVGINGGVKGAEIGGLFNLNKDDVTGFQVAGLGNQVSAGSKAFQVSGLYNFTASSDYTFQVSGLTNISRAGTVSGQVTSLVNVNSGDLEGMQATGLVNTNKGYVKGLQIAGLVNNQSKDLTGMQAAGLVNVNNEKTKGFQVAGLVNANQDSIQGAQVAGLYNFTKTNSHGFQAAGLVNTNSGTIKGAQIAGLVNFTNSLRGFQLSFINIADTVESGVPIGFMSIVNRNGYRRMEVNANEILFLNYTFKTGISYFYNIISIGIRPELDYHTWGFTYGIGTIAPLNDKMNLNIDLTSTQVSESEDVWTSELNLFNRLELELGYRIGNRIEITAGPSLVVHVSKITDDEGRISGSRHIPGWNFYDGVHRGSRLVIYPGFSAGIRF
ncbi:hypothetical protein ACFLU5_15970 [Bacteroidota bacterium]